MCEFTVQSSTISILTLCSSSTIYELNIIIFMWIDWLRIYRRFFWWWWLQANSMNVFHYYTLKSENSRNVRRFASDFHLHDIQMSSPALSIQSSVVIWMVITMCICTTHFVHTGRIIPNALAHIQNWASSSVPMVMLLRPLPLLLFAFIIMLSKSPA